MIELAQTIFFPIFVSLTLSFFQKFFSVEIWNALLLNKGQIHPCYFDALLGWVGYFFMWFKYLAPRARLGTSLYFCEVYDGSGRFELDNIIMKYILSRAISVAEPTCCVTA